MEAKIEIDGSDYAHASGASETGPSHMMLRKCSYDIGNGNSHNHIGKGSEINKTNVVDTLDLAVPQSKVRPIDRLLDRYDWSSASMTPLLQDSDHPQHTQHEGQQSRPGRSELPPPHRPQTPIKPPPSRGPPISNPFEFFEPIQPVRKSLWKRARELVSSFFERAVAAVPNVNCFW